MIRKRIIFGTICAGLLFARLFALSSCQANSEENFQYNLAPRNPIENDVLPLESIETKNNNINQNQQVQTMNAPVVTNTQRAEYVYTVSRPEWWEFCPIEYENPVHYKVAFTNAQFDSNDWYKLKQEFDSYLTNCDRQHGENRDICYSKLRSKFSYRVSNYESTRAKWANWANSIKYAEHESLKRNAINSAIRNGNSYIHMFSNF